MNDYPVGCGMRMPISTDSRGFIREGVPHLLTGPFDDPQGWDVGARTLCGRTIQVGSTYFASTWPKLTERCSRCVAVSERGKGDA